MIGIVFIYFIGKYFYDLALMHNRSKWGWAVLGVLSYYVGAVIITFILAIAVEFIWPGTIDEMNETLVNLLTIPFGFLSVFLFYRLLKRNWENKGVDKDLEGFIDSGL